MNCTTGERVAVLLKPGPPPHEVRLTATETEFALDTVSAALAARRAAVKPAPRFQKRIAWAALAATLVAGLVALFLLRPPSPEGGRALSGSLATLTDTSGTRLLTEGEGLRVHARIRTPVDGRLTLRFSEGSTLSLAQTSDVTVTSLGKERSFALKEGRLTAAVMKLSPHERFVVTTALGDVEVRGTRFSVAVQSPSNTCKDGTTTVEVEEGVVAFHGKGEEVLVHGGERQVLGCEAKALPPPPVAVVTPPAPPPSSLTRMNAQYARAMTLKREGNLKAAAKALHTFRAEFPMSPLDEAAAVEQLRLLKITDKKAARAAAKTYLKDYPEGYARDVAERLVGP